MVEYMNDVGWDHLLANLLTMAQNSSKLKPSLLEVRWLMWVLWMSSSRSSSLIVSWICFAMILNSSKSTVPFSSLSKRENTLRRPSLVLVSPTFEAMVSTNSSKPMGLFFSFRPSMSLRTKGFLLSRPSSSRTLLISTGSMVPLPSSSKTSKVFFSSSQSSALRRSFQAVGAGLTTFPELVGALALEAGGATLALLIISESRQQFLIEGKLQIGQKDTAEGRIKKVKAKYIDIRSNWKVFWWGLRGEAFCLVFLGFCRRKPAYSIIYRTDTNIKTGGVKYVSNYHSER